MYSYVIMINIIIRSNSKENNNKQQQQLLLLEQQNNHALSAKRSYLFNNLHGTNDLFS